MKKISIFKVFVPLALSWSLNACDAQEPERGEAEHRMAEVGSCEPDECGGQSADGCWCDDQCEIFGDCCEDYGPVCDPPPSCEGVCGGQSDAGCWCDDQCEAYGDCCEDYGPVCEPPATCEGACGGQADAGCWCDDQCETYGDCCEDKVDQCDPVFCTQDALLCPDGTVLGREGPDCEFPACPCESDDECNPGETCNPLLNECVDAPGCEAILCLDTQGCVEDEFGVGSCVPSEPVNCDADDDCPPTQRCVPFLNECVDAPGCEAILCLDTQGCVEDEFGVGSCVPTGGACELDCAPGEVCHPLIGACIVPVGCEAVLCEVGTNCVEDEFGLAACTPVIQPLGCTFDPASPGCSSQPCGADVECPTGTECVEYAEGSLCEAVGCEDIKCEEGEVCSENEDGVAHCEQSSVAVGCADLECPPSQSCFPWPGQDAQCEPIEKICDDLDCEDDQACVQGAKFLECLDMCGDIICAADEVCDNDPVDPTCVVPPGPSCALISCSAGETCVDGDAGGACVPGGDCGEAPCGDGFACIYVDEGPAGGEACLPLGGDECEELSCGEGASCVVTEDGSTQCLGGFCEGDADCDDGQVCDVCPNVGSCSNGLCQCPARRCVAA